MALGRVPRGSAPDHGRRQALQFGCGRLWVLVTEQGGKVFSDKSSDEARGGRLGDDQPTALAREVLDSVEQNRLPSASSSASLNRSSGSSRPTRSGGDTPKDGVNGFGMPRLYPRPP